MEGLSGVACMNTSGDSADGPNWVERDPFALWRQHRECWDDLGGLLHSNHCTIAFGSSAMGPPITTMPADRVALLFRNPR